ncbi:hypothetical protein VTN77DRAFT_2301 [Rasamsonia byssochlamydoides]|uniref:uncharacterized protein n=1 Tax=Rasamsonia byssochlamydoides TaxID=89139 RepID=UPI003742F119
MSGVTESSALAGRSSSALAGRSSSQRPRANANNTAAALQGATIAFNAYPPKNPASKNNQNNQNPNGAMRAALAADRAKPSPNRLDPENPEDGSVMDKIRKFSENSVSSSSRQGEEDRVGRLGPRVQTPQLLAATKAAERSATRTPQHPTPTRSISPGKRAISGDKVSTGDNVDQKGAQPAPTLDGQPQPLPAPIPIRRISSKKINIGDGDDLDSRSNTWNSQQPISSNEPDAPESRENSTTRSTSPVKAPARERPSESTSEPVNRIPSRRESAISPRSLTPRASSQVSKESPRLANTRPSLSLLDEQKPKLPPRPSASNSNGEDQAFLASLRDEIPKKKRSDSVSTPSTYLPSISDQTSISTRTPVSRYDNGDAEEAPGMSKESLADAIIASSLASSRAPSPMKVPPPLPPPRRPRSRSLLHPGSILKGESRRTPSPPKGLRQTLRDPSKSDDEEEKQKKLNRRYLIPHHPHKHHEGDRKRWRREVTERERKRYEGVWAANKGLWIPPDALRNRGLTEEQDSSRHLVPSDMVVNLVVRDIWSRSRLPAHVLEQIWDLVDRNGIGMLTREEFVIGMWLIDQQLKGHKLPVKVPDSVWESVRHVSGIKLPSEF